MRVYAGAWVCILFVISQSLHKNVGKVVRVRMNTRLKTICNSTGEGEDRRWVRPVYFVDIYTSQSLQADVEWRVLLSALLWTLIIHVFLL